MQIIDADGLVNDRACLESVVIIWEARLWPEAVLRRLTGKAQGIANFF
jgi:hypothetical protein